MFKDLREYIANLEIDKSEPTIRSYVAALDRFVKFFSLDSSDALNALTSDDIRRYQKDLRETLAASSVNSHYRIIKAFVGWLLENDKIIRNPLKGVHFLDEGEKNVAVFFTIEERDAMLNTCHNPNKKLLLAVLFYQGLRREEAVNVMVSDFDAEHATLVIHGKRGKQVKQDLNPYVVRLFREYMKERKSDSEYLFCTRKKGFGTAEGWHPITGESVLQMVRAAALRAGISSEKVAQAGAHTTRRSCACHLALLGLNDFTIQSHMRHEKITTTQLYIEPARKLLSAKAALALPEPKGF